MRCDRGIARLGREDKARRDGKAMGAARMRGEILAEVERLRPWFHCIDLGEGMKTKTESVADEPVDHPWGTWQTIRKYLPEDLSGKSVLDVGCNAGFYAVEAKRLGAARVLGIDAQRFHIRQALFVRRILGLDIDFRRMSVYDLSPRTVGQFDVTLALGLIYHCKHLVRALENLWHVTKELLIIETAIYPPEKLPEPFEHPVAGPGRLIHSFAYIENPPDAQEPVYNWFMPSVDGLRALLKNLGVEEVTVFAVEGTRAVLICHKQQIYADSRILGNLAATLTLVSGATTCRPSAELQFAICVENSGFTRWLAGGEADTGKGAVSLSAHLLGDDEEELVWNYGRAPLKRDIAPGEVAYLDIRLQAPERPGMYYVEFDMLAEELAWFEDLGSATLRHELRIEP